MKNIRLFNVALLLFCVLFVQDSRAQDDNPFSLPEGARARLGKGKLGDVAYSPDGRRLAVTSNLGVWLYDAHTYTEVALLTDPTEGIGWVVFSPDKKILATVSEDRTAVGLWDADRGALKVRLDGLADWVFDSYIARVLSVAFSPDGKTLAISVGYEIWLLDMDSILASDDTVIVIRDWDMGEPLKAVLHNVGGGMGSVVFSPDGKILASDDGYEIWLLDMDSILASDDTMIDLSDTGWAFKDTLEGHTDSIAQMAFSPDGKTIASASRDQTVLLWDADSGTRKTTLKGHTDQVLSVAFSPDGKTVASASRNGTVLLWDADSGTRKTALKGHTDQVLSVAFSPDGKTVASASWDQTVLLWDADSGTVQATLEGYTGGVSSVALAPDGKTIVAVVTGHEIWLWDTDSGALKTILQGQNRISSVVFSPDGKTLASIHRADVLLWDTGSGSRKTTLEGHTNQVYSVVFSPDGKTIATASSDSTARLWDADSGILKAILSEGYTGWPYPATFSPDGKTLASASYDGSILLWDTGSGSRKTALKGHTDEITSVRFSPDGKTLASASYDGSILLWDTGSGSRKATLEDQRDRLFWLRFSPDGKIIAAISVDSTAVPYGKDDSILLWDADSGSLKATLEGHRDWVSWWGFSPDGKTLLSASADGTILLWDMCPYIPPSTPTAVPSAATRLPMQTALLANFPNPFNPATYIPYQLHTPAHVRLTIYDVRGALVRELDLGYRAAGQYLTSPRAARWDGRDRRGQRVASGVYLYRLQAGPVAHVRKMVVIK